VNWRDISYLRKGITKQRDVYEAVVALGILDSLSSFDAVLVSTICVGFDTEESDLDFICRFHSLARFEAVLKSEFGDYKDFVIRRRKPDGSEIVASFCFRSFLFEVFGSRVPVERQNAYRHLSVMRRLAEIGGQGFRNRVRAKKRTGLKTEPAIATLLGLEGDPFEAVLLLENAQDSTLRRLIRKSTG